jgi:ketosteroid isomerase-like protein
MSAEDIEVVRQMLKAWDRGDGDAVFAAFAPEIEWDMSDRAEVTTGDFDAFGITGFFKGRDAVRAWLRDWFNAWEVSDSALGNIETDRLIDAGDHVVHFLRQRVRGRRSGIEMTFPPYAQVWTVRGGKIVRMKLYWDRERALEAVGLAE